MRNLFIIIVLALICLTTLLVITTNNNTNYQSQAAIKNTTGVANSVRLDSIVLHMNDSIIKPKAKIVFVAPEKSIVVTATIIAEEQVRAVKLEADKKVVTIQTIEVAKRQKLYSQINRMAKELDSLRKRK